MRRRSNRKENFLTKYLDIIQIRLIYAIDSMQTPELSRTMNDMKPLGKRDDF